MIPMEPQPTLTLLPRRLWAAAFVLLAAYAACCARAEDGYRLWLRYDRIDDDALRAGYAAAIRTVILSTPHGTDSPTLSAARSELTAGLGGRLWSTVTVELEKSTHGLEKTPGPVPELGNEGYALSRRGADTILIDANR